MQETTGFLNSLFRRKDTSQTDANKPDSVPKWNRTVVIRERMRGNQRFEEKGVIKKVDVYEGRRVINKDKRINSGVYLGASKVEEAIVVDDNPDKDPLLNELYERFVTQRLAQMEQNPNSHFKDGILEAVWELVMKIMPYDSNKVDSIVTGHADEKMYLSSFFGGGVCRHQALLAGYILERLVDEGVLRGTVSVDRNLVPGEGGHAWVRYESPSTGVVILDPAQEYVGLLSDMSEQQDRWFYERPEDISRFAKLRASIRRRFLGDLNKRHPRKSDLAARINALHSQTKLAA